MTEKKGELIEPTESGEKIESEKDEKTKEIEKMEEALELRLSKIEDMVNSNDPKKTTEYVYKLRDEAAAKRILAEQLEKEKNKTKETLKEKSKRLVELEKKLAEYEDKKKENELADASEIEKLTAKLNDFENKLKEKEEQLALKDKLTTELTKKQKINERQTFIDRLISENNGSFSSEFERLGFISQFLSLDSDIEFEKSDEEITLAVDQFLLGKRKQEAKGNSSSNKAGPIKKMANQPFEEELKNLLNKTEPLTDKEFKRLDEISKEIG